MEKIVANFYIEKHFLFLKMDNSSIHGLYDENLEVDISVWIDKSSDSPYFDSFVSIKNRKNNSFYSTEIESDSLFILVSRVSEILSEKFKSKVEIKKKSGVYANFICQNLKSWGMFDESKLTFHFNDNMVSGNFLKEIRTQMNCHNGFTIIDNNKDGLLELKCIKKVS